MDFPQRNSDFGAPPTAAAGFPMAYILRAGGRVTGAFAARPVSRDPDGHEMNLSWVARAMARKRDDAKKDYFFKVIGAR